MTYANSTPNESSGNAETSAPAAAQQYCFVEHLHLVTALIELRSKEACPSIAYDVHGALISRERGSLNRAPLTNRTKAQKPLMSRRSCQ